jgi:hypothetical protein
MELTHGWVLLPVAVVVAVVVVMVEDERTEHQLRPWISVRMEQVAVAVEEEQRQPRS